MFCSFRSCSFCDSSCNVSECAFDAGDCGRVAIGDGSNPAATPLSLPSASSVPYSPSVSHYSLRLADGDTVAVWNVTQAFLEYDEVGVVDLEAGGQEQKGKKTKGLPTGVRY